MLKKTDKVHFEFADPWFALRAKAFSEILSFALC
jgi:hypothetical protein